VLGVIFSNDFSYMKLDQLIGIFTESLEELPDCALTGETNFKDLKAWDSLAVLTVTDEIDMEYGVLLRKTDFQKLQTIQDLCEFVNAKRGDG
jgi:acyl carrier protein